MTSRLQGNQQDRCGAAGARVGASKGRFQPFSSRQERCRGEHSPCLRKPEHLGARPEMAVTRGSAKRSSCCPSTGNQAPGGSASAAEASNVSNNPGAPASDDNANAAHQRGGAGHRQSKRPALVDRTNDGTTAGPSTSTGPIGVNCPDEAQAQALESAPEATIASVAALGNTDSLSRQGLPTHGIGGFLATAQVSGTTATLTSGAQGPPGLSLTTESGSAGLASQSTGSVHPAAAGIGVAGFLGNAANSRASSRRSGTSIRGRVKGKGSAPASMAGTRRQRSESGDQFAMEGASEEEAPQLATGLSDASRDRAMDCDRQDGMDEGDAAEQGMVDADTGGRQLLSTEALLCCGESDALGGGPGEASEEGLLAATSTSLSERQDWGRPLGASDRGAGKGSAEGKVEGDEPSKNGEPGLAVNLGVGPGILAPAPDGIPETCCKNYFGAPGGNSFGSSASCTQAAINSLLATNEDLGPPSAQAIRNPGLASSADLSVGPGDGGSDPSLNGREMAVGSSAGHWGVGSQSAVASGPALFGSFPGMGAPFAPGSTVSIRTSAPGLHTGGPDAANALQERLQGSAVQAADSAMASLQRHAERSWQISSIRQNRTAGMPSGDADWLSKSQEQPLSRQLDRDCATASAPALPTLLGSLPATDFGPLPYNMAAGNAHPFIASEQQQMPAFQKPTAQGQAPVTQLQAQPLAHPQPQLGGAPHAALAHMEVNQGGSGAPLAHHHHLHQQQQQQQQQEQQSQQQQQLIGQQAAPSALMHQDQQQQQQGLAHLSQFLAGTGARGAASQGPSNSQPQGNVGVEGTEPALSLSRPAPMGIDNGAGSAPGGGVASSWGGVGGVGGPMAAMQGCLKGLSGHMDIDGNHSDPQLCASYAAEIFQHLRHAETQRRPTMGYMETVQSDINEQMRGILIDWLVEVAEEYKLVADTLYLTCSFIDRYLSTTMVARGRLQLLGVSCMLIASKYEEIYAPQVDEFCYITDNTYRKEEVIEMERTVLKELEFELSYPTVKSFLRRFIRAAQADLPEPSIELELLGNFFAELTLVDYGSLKFPPSVIAASAVFLAKRTLWPDTHPWTSTLQHYSSYTPSYLKECIQNLHDLHCNKRRCTLPAIREKYRQAKFKHVASIAPCPELPEELFIG